MTFFSIIRFWNKELLFSTNLQTLWDLPLYPNIYFRQRRVLLKLIPTKIWPKNKSKIVWGIAISKFKTFQTNLEKKSCHSWHATSRPLSQRKGQSSSLFTPCLPWIPRSAVSLIACEMGKYITLPLAPVSHGMDGFPSIHGRKAGSLPSLFIFDTSRTRVQDLTRWSKHLIMYHMRNSKHIIHRPSGRRWF